MLRARWRGTRRAAGGDRQHIRMHARTGESGAIGGERSSPRAAPECVNTNKCVRACVNVLNAHTHTRTDALTHRSIAQSDIVQRVLTIFIMLTRIIYGFACKRKYWFRPRTWRTAHQRPYGPGADMSGTLSTLIHTPTHVLAIRSFADNLWPRTHDVVILLQYLPRRDLWPVFVACMLNVRLRLLVVVVVQLVILSVGKRCIVCVCFLRAYHVQSVYAWMGSGSSSSSSPPTRNSSMHYSGRHMFELGHSPQSADAVGGPSNRQDMANRHEWSDVKQ